MSTETHYYGIVQKNGSAVIHTTSCHHALRANVRTGLAATDVDPADRACTHCLPKGVQAAEDRRLIQPWADRYSALSIALEEHCRSLSEDELEALGRAAEYPTQTNCGWADYGVAPLVRQAVRWERGDRLRAADPVTSSAATTEEDQ